MKFVLLLLIADCATSHAQQAVLSWYPLEPGNSWTWQNDALDGDASHPRFERWTMDRTVVSIAPDTDLGGTLVTMRNRILSDVTSPDFDSANNAARRLPSESHLLIFRNCVYILDGQDVGSPKISPGSGHNLASYHDELLRGSVQPDFCFPLTVGMTWGRIPGRVLDPDFVWNVVSLNADPYGPSNETTFGLNTRAGSGTVVNRWFTKGIGVVQENTEHHGTYDEDRARLLRATIGGKLRVLTLHQPEHPR